MHAFLLALAMSAAASAAGAMPKETLVSTEIFGRIAADPAAVQLLKKKFIAASQISGLKLPEGMQIIISVSGFSMQAKDQDYRYTAVFYLYDAELKTRHLIYSERFGPPPESIAVRACRAFEIIMKKAEEESAKK